MKEELLKYIRDIYDHIPDEYAIVNLEDKNSNCFLVSGLSFASDDKYHIVIRTEFKNIPLPVWNTISFPLAEVPAVNLEKFLETYRKMNGG